MPSIVNIPLYVYKYRMHTSIVLKINIKNRTLPVLSSGQGTSDNI